MDKRYGDRILVRRWQTKLVELTKAGLGDDPKEWLASDIAQIESGFYGLLAILGSERAYVLAEAILKDILKSYANPKHWRNKEGST
jgi:hypothetical protein